MDLTLGRLFAIATLIDITNSDSSTPEGLHNLAGQQLVETVQPLSTVEENEAGRISLSALDTLGHISFPDLTIRNPGVYRIRVTLLSVGSSSGISSSRPQGGASVNTIETEAITVV
jgi:hypothetical protein